MFRDELFVKMCPGVEGKIDNGGERHRKVVFHRTP